MKMSPRLWRGFGLRGSPSRGSEPQGPRLARESPLTTIPSPAPPGRGPAGASASRSHSKPPPRRPLRASVHVHARVRVCVHTHVCMCTRVHTPSLFFPALIKVAAEVRGGSPGPSHCEGPVALGSRAPGVPCLCLCDFQNSLSALLLINNCECCRPRAWRARDNGAVGGRLGAADSLLRRLIDFIFLF